jgi:hypothetical protein
MGYTFKVLSEAEVLQGLNDAGIDRKLTIESPKPMIVASIYKQFLSIIASLEEAEMEHPHLAVSIEPSQEELKGGFAFLNFYEQMLLLTQSASIPNFCLEDILRPDKARILFIFSGLINFAIFREGRLKDFQALQESVNDKIRENKDMEDQVKLLDEKLAQRQAQNVDQRKEVDILQNKKRSVATKISEIEEAITGIQKSREDVKRKSVRVKNELDITLKDIEKMNQEVTDLQIKSSLCAEEIIKDLERARRENQQEAELQEQMDQKSLAMTKKSKYLAKVLAKLVALDDVTQPVLQEQKKLGEVQAESDRVNSEKVKLAQKRAEIQALRVQMNEMAAEQEKEQESVKQTQEAIKKQNAALSGIAAQRQRILDELADRMDGIRSRIRSFRDQVNNSMNLVPRLEGQL